LGGLTIAYNSKILDLSLLARANKKIKIRPKCYTFVSRLPFLGAVLDPPPSSQWYRKTQNIVEYNYDKKFKFCYPNAETESFHYI